MKEIEILYPLESNVNDAFNNLKDFKFKGSKKTLDIYFFDEDKEDLKPANGRIRNCFRLRSKDNQTYLTYKNNQYEGDTWIYSDEYEINTDSFEQSLKIIESLKLKELVRVDNTKHTFTNETYELIIEEVESLGKFLEVELRVSDDVTDILAEKQKIRNFVNSLGLKIGEELNVGKPELMLNKKEK